MGTSHVLHFFKIISIQPMDVGQNKHPETESQVNRECFSIGWPLYNLQVDMTWTRFEISNHEPSLSPQKAIMCHLPWPHMSKQWPEKLQSFACLFVFHPCCPDRTPSGSWMIIASLHRLLQLIADLVFRMAAVGNGQPWDPKYAGMNGALNSALEYRAFYSTWNAMNRDATAVIPQRTWWIGITLKVQVVHCPNGQKVMRHILWLHLHPSHDCKETKSCSFLRLPSDFS